MKVGTTIYIKGCEKLTTEFDMRLSGTIVYTTKLQAKCIKMGWHMGTQQIINFAKATGSTINILHQYGQIDTTTLQALLQEHWSPVPSKSKAKQLDDEKVYHEDAYTSSQSQTLTFPRRLQD
jgi:hypothetical protein